MKPFDIYCIGAMVYMTCPFHTQQDPGDLFRRAITWPYQVARYIYVTLDGSKDIL